MTVPLTLANKPSAFQGPPLPPESSEPIIRPAEVAAKPRRVKAPRLLALDAFRGLTIFLMLLVNNVSLGSQTPAQLMHAEWSGRVHVADLVFPWFLFMVGVAVPYAAASARKRHVSHGGYALKAVTRTAVLVGLGCLLASVAEHRLVWTLGVLQLIGLSYLCAAIAGIFFGVRGRVVLTALLLWAHSALLHHYPVPGVGADAITEQANAVKYLNETLLMPLGLKGIISVIPATAMVLIGTVAGDLLRRKKVPSLGKAGVLASCGAGLWAGSIFWGQTLPMNKPLWTGSYILYTAGLGCLVLSALYLLLDVPQGKVGRATRAAALPLVVFGSNAIVAYVAPILFKFTVLQGVTVATHTQGHVTLERALQEYCYQSMGRIHGGWVYTFGYIAVWWLVLAFLYNRRWFLRA